MRILRSQYLELRQQVNQPNNYTSSIGKKVPAQSSDNETQNNFNSYIDGNNNNEFITLTQTSTVTTTTKTIRRQSLLLSDNDANRLFSNSNAGSKLDDIYGFTGFPETENNKNITPKQIKQRRQTMATFHQQHEHTMQIQFCNVPKTVRKINVTVEFVHMSSLWLTRIYQSYENDLWQKRIRNFDNSKSKKKSKKKWFYDCLLCFKQYCGYTSLKSHLNHHLELYPYTCKLCYMQYTNRNAITRHFKSKHHVGRDDWNEYIG